MSAIEQNREITLTRVFNAPASVLFEAYSKPEHIKRWFGPVGYPVTTAKIDFRVGGSFWFQMTGPTGELNTPFGGTYLEVVPNEKLRYTDVFDDPNLPGEMVTTITLKTVSCGTDFTAVQEGIPEMIPPEMCYLGWQESLRMLARVVEPEIPG